MLCQKIKPHEQPKLDFHDRVNISESVDQLRAKTPRANLVKPVNTFQLQQTAEQKRVLFHDIVGYATYGMCLFSSMRLIFDKNHPSGAGHMIAARN